jgi:hypothetical protein
MEMGYDMDYLGVGWPHILISFEERAVSCIAGSSWAPLIYANHPTKKWRSHVQGRAEAADNPGLYITRRQRPDVEGEQCTTVYVHTTKGKYISGV